MVVHLLRAVADAFLDAVRAANVPLAGLMCIPPADTEAAPFFAFLAKLASDHGLEGLSMGMSGDYETAVMLGATHVRVGTALFGASLFAIGLHGRLVNCGNASGDEAVIPSLGYLFHSGISILGSDPYRPDEFGPVWDNFCAGHYDVVIDSVFPLSEAAAAQQKMVSNDFFGKILLTP